MSDSAVSIQRQYYAETAADYDVMHLVDKEHNRALELTCNYMLQMGLSQILDVGCGTGRGVKYLLDRDFLAFGIEPVEELLEAGFEKHDIPREHMQVGTGERIESPDKSFDATIELGVLHHVPDPSKVVSEMIRVSRRAIFISDSNRFGQGPLLWRLMKVVAWKMKLWGIIDFARTRGKGYTISEEDGLAYSYSVYDSFNQLAEWADEIHLIPTTPATCTSWLHPLVTSSHVLLVAMKSEPQNSTTPVGADSP